VIRKDTYNQCGFVCSQLLSVELSDAVQEVINEERTEQLTTTNDECDSITETCFDFPGNFLSYRYQ
jgi:hypothetical protein